MKPGLNEATWPALREYIAAEIKLAIARHEIESATSHAETISRAKEIEKLERQSTRMETAFRGYMPMDPAAARRRYLEKNMPTQAEIGAALAGHMKKARKVKR